MNPQQQPQNAFTGRVYCPICTHTVEGQVRMAGPKPKVVAGQKCSRCQAALDAGIVLAVQQAAA